MGAGLGFVKRHPFAFAFTLAGAFGGWLGVAGGLAAGIFADLIAGRFIEEWNLKKALDGDSAYTEENQPFSGALYLCGIVVYCTQDVSVAVRNLEVVFSASFPGDWRILCTAAKDSSSLNVDLFTECLAACLKKSPDTFILRNIFELLNISEFTWNESDRGMRPSAYLAELLNYTFVNDELNAAYAILGLDPSATEKEVKAAHRKLAARFHPDKTGKEGQSAFTEIQNAYEYIMASGRH